MRVSYATEAEPVQVPAGYLFIGVAAGSFLVQGLALLLAKSRDSIFELILLPMAGICQLLTPIFRAIFQGVSDKAHWPVIILLLVAMTITSLLLAGVLVGLGKLATRLSCRH